MTERLAVYVFPKLAEWSSWLFGVVTRAPPRAELPPRALLIWRERPDLQDAFDLKTSKGRAGLFWWCLLHGFRELGLRFDPDLDGGFEMANQPIPHLPRTGCTPVTWLMRALYRHNCNNNSDLRQGDAQLDVLAHVFTQGLTQANLGGLLDVRQAKALKVPDPSSGLPMICRLIWHAAPEVRAKFESCDAGPFEAWCRSEGAREYPILAHPLIALAAPPLRRRRQGRIKGVNLFGHALGRLGLGEDVRMAAKSLEAAGIPYVIRNVEAVAAGQDEGLRSPSLSADLPYDVNLFCMTAESTLAAIIAQGPAIGEGRYNIGVWPWELPEWPQAWDHAWDFVDEVWATSRFTYDAYKRAAPIPVMHMPMAVNADATDGATRADFGLPQDHFLFGYSFDGLSSFARKNPQAVIAAFRKAFSPSEFKVGLVLKSIRGMADQSAWQALGDLMHGDQQIHVIDKSLSRGSLLDLYRSFDAFVSLHRSEGFGRNIAEAMLLAKPVIVSAYSGNMDFADDDTAALVPTGLREVRQGEYPFGAGQKWGEPDVDAAACLMRRMVIDRDWRQGLAANASKRIRQRYSLDAVAKAWSGRLRELV
ncbi:glycosyltransferase family 4 protein [Erythrobacter sp. sf7]|uniref:Glycosyltransferase family 4 protein n=1 Tax=Erythrobacter fulvus TaxID=2987523 RepID=A0ABT5JM11_9SPHN|nr:glycosyltransferase family 4 protein [Erythrobacter fulvus]MDC8753788.1 glycosyltransferase family 4 protein [Erythrobacter fulvus]